MALVKDVKHLHLVDDDKIQVGRKHRYRVQVWRGRTTAGELQPVVLLIALPKMPPVAWYSEVLATTAWRVYLGSKLPLPIFFHYNGARATDPAVAFRVDFMVSGYALRPWIHEPTYAKVDPRVIERVFHLEG